MKRTILTALFLFFSLTNSSCEKSSTDKKSNAEGGITIAMIPKGTTHEFWKSVNAGGEDAARELNIKLIWKGPLREDQASEQISIVESFVSDKVSAIVLAPLNDAALVSPVATAHDKKIPVIIIDSPLKGEAGKDFASLVATDNYKGGEAAGAELVKALGDGPKKVVLLRYAVGSASTESREKGFLDTIAKHKNLTVISDNQYAGATTDSAKKAAENLMDKLKEADGVFCPNESSTRGMLMALSDNHLAGKIKFVGFDASEPLLAAVKSGEIAALVAQNPRNMGYLGVKTAVAIIRGEKVPTSIDTGSGVITAKNMDDPAIKKLLGK